ncbi:DUF3352 domain-containing protein [Alkalinema pantanalense CENA528]|uniref:DUF3352 domain-containing protein n=1 Tax=Alkalinema pantanalense TaxID=1620705 RepID=UPI003D6EE832
MAMRRIFLPVLSALTLGSIGLSPQPGMAQSSPQSPLPALAPSQTTIAPPSISKILPADTAGIFLMNPDDALWEDLAKFGLFPRDFTTPGFLFSPIVGSVNFYTDVQPWLGGSVGIALLSGSGMSNTRMVMLAPVKDATPIPKFLDRVKQQQRKPPIEQTYKGVTLLVWEPEALGPSELPDKAPSDSPEQDSPEQDSPEKIEAIRTHSPQPSANLLSLAVKSDPVSVTSSKVSDTFSTIPSNLSKTPRIYSNFQSTENSIAITNPASPDNVPLPSPPQPQTPRPRKVFKLPGYAIAYLPSGYVVSATTPEAIRKLIDAQEQPDRLSENPGFQKTFSDPRFPKSLFMGFGSYSKLIASSLEDTTQNLQDFPFAMPFPLPNASPDLAQTLETYYGEISGFAWAQPEGLRMQGSLTFKKPIPPEMIQAVTSPNLLPERMPQVTYGMTNSTNLAFYWKIFNQGIELNPRFKTGVENFRKLSQSLVGLDDRDIFPWMDKEYAGFVFPTQGGFFPTMDPKLAIGVGMLIQTSDRATAEKTLTKVDNLITTRFAKDFTIKPREIKGQKFTSWEVAAPSNAPRKRPNPTSGSASKKAPSKPSTPLVSILSHGWVAPDTLMVVSGIDSATNLVPTPWTKLSDSTNFQAAIAPLPQPNMGYFYLNPSAMIALANGFGFGEVLKTPIYNEPDRTVGDVVGSIRSLSGTSNIESNSISSDGFLALASRPLKPLTAQELIELGDKKGLGDSDSAIANYNRALRLEPNNSEVYFKRAIVRQQSSDFVGAIADLDQTLEKNSQNSTAYLLRSLAKSKLYDFPGTIADSTAALKLSQPPSAKAYEVRAYAKVELEDYPGAIEDATQAINLYEANAMPSDIKNAGSNFTLSRIVGGDSHTSLGNRCYARAQLGEFAKAVEDCNQAIELDMAEVEAELFAARCYARVGLGEKIALKEDCGWALELNPDSPDVHEAHGLARKRLGDLKGAEISLKKAKDLYQKRGNLTAVQRVERAIASLPQKP